jgi:flap endonuclease-1
MDEVKKGMKWDKPEESKLREFLIEDKGFTEVKVNNGIEKLAKCNGKANQSRLDLFFKPSGLSTSSQQ